MEGFSGGIECIEIGLVYVMVSFLMECRALGNDLGRGIGVLNGFIIRVFGFICSSYSFSSSYKKLIFYLFWWGEHICFDHFL